MLGTRKQSMRKLIIIFGALALFGGAGHAGDGEFGDDELMQTIKETNENLSSNIAQQNAQGSAENAKELRELFGKVETHFVSKGGADNAVDLARKSETFAEDIVKAVAASQFDAAADTATNLSRACRTCHTFYKKS